LTKLGQRLRTDGPSWLDSYWVVHVEAG
jgi:hypothetical protein